LVSFSKAEPKNIAPSPEKPFFLFYEKLLNNLKLSFKDVKFLSFSKAIPKDLAPSADKIFYLNLKKFIIIL
jgi:hypothetical protein